MNNTNPDSKSSNIPAAQSRSPASTVDELATVKRALLKAEVSLARARTTVVTAEIDVRVLTARLRELSR